MAKDSRTALLIHCSRGEADRIREAALRERRTISGFVLNAVMSRFQLESRISARREAHRQAELEDRAHSDLAPRSHRLDGSTA